MKENSIDKTAVKIVDEGKQLSIRIPKEYVDLLDINPDKDSFVFVLDKNKLHLEGELVDKNQLIKEENIKKNGSKENPL